MRRFLVLITAVVLACCCLVSTASAQPVQMGPGPMHLLRTTDSPHANTALSSNWSGYALLGKFRAAKGTFTVPACSDTSAGYASQWVGVDGYSSNDPDLIQAGVDETYDFGSCSYQMWWEILPSPSVDIAWMNVKAGDQLTVSIRHEPQDLNAGVGPWNWSVNILDQATGQDFEQAFNYNGPATSVEWVDEAPEVGGAINNVLHTTPVTFTNLEADGHAGVLSDIWLVQSGMERELPSSVDSARQLMTDGFTAEYVGS